MTTLRGEGPALTPFQAPRDDGAPRAPSTAVASAAVTEETGRQGHGVLLAACRAVGQILGERGRRGVAAVRGAVVRVPAAGAARPRHTCPSPGTLQNGTGRTTEAHPTPLLGSSP